MFRNERGGILVRYILVVLNSAPDAMHFIEVIWQGAQYAFLIVRDHKQAFEIIGSFKPDLFLLEYQLPPITGIELYDQLHTAKGIAEVPGIVLCEEACTEDIDQAIAIRQIRYLKVPIDLPDLLNAIEQTCNVTFSWS